MQNNFLEKTLNILAPPQCFGCFCFISNPHGFCQKCWDQIEVMEKNHCKYCAEPLPEKIFSIKPICWRCHENKPLFSKTFAPFLYNDFMKGLILRFKNYDEHLLALFFTKHMLQSLKGNKFDIIVPVPLHWRRLFWRQFNQSAELTHLLSKALNKPKNCTSLVRTKSTPSQGKKTRKERISNISDAFAWKNREDINKKHVLLVDDVFTTGATLQACCKVLKNHGAAKITTAVIARAPAYTSKERN